MKKLTCFVIIVGVAAAACGPDPNESGLFGGTLGYPPATPAPDGGATAPPDTDAATPPTPMPGADASTPPPGQDAGYHHHDAGAPPAQDAAPPQDAGSPQDAGAPLGDAAAGQAPTWTQIYDSYLATGTVGACAGCHSSTTSPSATYTWLQGRGYMNGTQTSLSFLSWMGGNMPPSGPTSLPQATTDIDAWIAAGALNN